MKNDHAPGRGRCSGAAHLMKLGAAVVATALGAPALGAQRGGAGRGSADAADRPMGVRPHTEAGWINDANRGSGNGPMDETTRQIVKYVSGFSDSVLTDAVVHTVNRTMVDTMSCLISGFESEPARICARLARMYRCDLKSTVMGYGIATSPDLATFANGSMARYADFNDIGPGNHTSDNIAGVLAIGEALHSSGAQVMVATVLAYEIAGALAGAGRIVPAGGANGGGWDDWVYLPATSMAVGKLMGLNEDQLANALSLAIVPHMPMNVTHTGALSHWKACRASENVRHGVWAAIMAREGMTGPSMPFEARNGVLRSHRRLSGAPASGERRRDDEHSEDGNEANAHRRIVAGGAGAGSAAARMDEGGRHRVDPLRDAVRRMAGNRRSAEVRPAQSRDSRPQHAVSARSRADGRRVSISTRSRKRSSMDPAARQLMAKMTFWPQPDWTGNAPARITIRKKSGEEKSWDSFNGVRNAPPGEVNTPMTDAEIDHKFNRVCAYMQVADAQRDRARAAWGNLRAVKDIGDAIRTLATFGRPAPL